MVNLVCLLHMWSLLVLKLLSWELLIINHDAAASYIYMYYECSFFLVNGNLFVIIDMPSMWFICYNIYFTGYRDSLGIFVGVFFLLQSTHLSLLELGRLLIRNDKELGVTFKFVTDFKIWARTTFYYSIQLLLTVNRRARAYFKLICFAAV